MAQVFGFLLKRRTQCIKGAFFQLTMFSLPIPAEERSESPSKREQPDSDDAQQSSVVGHWLGGNTFYDDVVAVEGNHCHSPDRGTTE